MKIRVCLCSSVPRKTAQLIYENYAARWSPQVVDSTGIMQAESIGVPPKLTLTVLPPADPERWEADVLRLGGCCFHTQRWLEFSAAAGGATPLCFSWLNGSGVRQALAVGTRNSIRMARVPLLRTLSLGSLPIASHGVEMMDLVRELVRYARNERFARLHIHSFGTPWDLPELAALGFTVSRRWEFLSALDAKREALWANLHAKKRNLIRKAEKEGVRVASCTALEDLVQFRKITAKTSQRKRERGIEFPPVADESYYRLLYEHVLRTGLGRLYLAHLGTTCLAGAFFVGFAGQAYYLLSAAGDLGLAKAAPDLILWKAICDFSDEGYKSLNFGGVSEQDLGGSPLEHSGLYHFKIRFCPKVLPCQKGTLEIRPRSLALLAQLKGRVRKANRK